MTTRRRLARVLVLVLGAAMAVAAAGCGFTDVPEEATGSSGSAVEAYLPIAEEATAKAMAGTNRQPATTPRPAVKGKKLGIVMVAEFVVSVGFPANAAKEAAEELGWQVSMFDANNDPNLFGSRVQDAITSGVDAIILVSIDCQKVKPQLQEAKRKNIKLASIFAFDCNDPLAGNEPEGLFDGIVNYGPAAADIDEFTKQYGADQANYIIAESKNQAKIIEVVLPEYTVLQWTHTGFEETVAKSGGSKIVETVELATSDITNAENGMVPKIRAALARNPDADWIKSPFTYVTTLGIDQVLATQPNSKIKVMGGEGYKEELDLMRGAKDTVTALNVIPAEWTGWAAVDTLNSVFLGQEPADSGLGWQVVDRTNVPTTEQYEPAIDYKAIYREAWGV